MRRFLLLLAVAAVGGGIYVAAAPGRSLHAGPTWKQFTSLQKQVAALKKDESAVKKLAVAEGVLLVDCTKHGAIPVGQFGDGTNHPQGYVYSQDGTLTSPLISTALDVSVSSDTNAAFFMAGDASCGNALSGNALRRAAWVAGLRIPQSSSHPVAFVAHMP